jgi:hypothetical protein
MEATKAPVTIFHISLEAGFGKGGDKILWLLYLQFFF